MMQFLAQHQNETIALMSAAFGAALGFFGSYWIWSLERKRQRRIVCMRIAIDLRRWLNRVLSQMYDVKNFISTDGNLGSTYSTIEKFAFEDSLEQVASVDYQIAMKIFKLIHRKDDASAQIEFEIDVGDDETASDLWRGKTAITWMRALRLYGRIAKQVGWSDKVVSEETRKMMEGEFDRYQKRKRKQAKSDAEFAKTLSVS